MQSVWLSIGEGIRTMIYISAVIFCKEKTMYISPVKFCVQFVCGSYCDKKRGTNDIKQEVNITCTLLGDKLK